MNATATKKKFIDKCRGMGRVSSKAALIGSVHNILLGLIPTRPAEKVADQSLSSQRASCFQATRLKRNLLPEFTTATHENAERAKGYDEGYSKKVHQ
jgi:hypothetical protein